MRKIPSIIVTILVCLSVSASRTKTVSQVPEKLQINTSDNTTSSRYWRLRDEIAVSSTIGNPQLMAFNPATSEIAVSGSKRIVIVGNPENKDFKIRLLKQGGVAFSPNGKVLATIGAAGNIYLWDCITGKMISMLDKHGSFVYSLSFSPDGNILAAQSVGSKRVFIWATATGSGLGNIPDGAEPVYPRAAKNLTEWVFRDIIQPGTNFFAENEFLSNAAISPDGKTLAITSNLAVSIWDIASKQALRKIGQHDGTIYNSAFSPDGTMMATGSLDQTAKLWDVATGRLKATLSGHQGAVVTLCFSPDGITLATVSKDNTVRLWEVPSGKLKAVLTKSGANLSVLFSPDGRQIVTATDKMVEVWNAGNGQLITALEGARYPVAYSPNGQILATAGEDKDILLWESFDATR